MRNTRVLLWALLIEDRDVPVLCAQATEKLEVGQWQRNRMDAKETGNLHQIPAASPSEHHGKLD